MSGQPGGQPVDTPKATVEQERHASWAELFFDLVVVAGVGLLARVLTAEQTPLALGLYAVLFLAFWLVWTSFMLYGNVAAGNTHVIRLLIGMVGLGVMAASAPQIAHVVLEGGHETRAPNAFAGQVHGTAVVGYVALVVLGHLWVERRDRAGSLTARRQPA